MIANVSFAACGASLIAAAVLALPQFFAREAAPAPTTTAFSIAPGPTRGSGMANLSMRF